MKPEGQATLEFAPDRSTAGFRLHQFSVLNWGTFHNRVHSFTPDGCTSLLSGGNGAGKSTLADAVLTLLIDSRKRNYNQASAGSGERKQKKERSEKDYILGTYSEDYDQERGYGRPKQLRKAGEAVTILLANFYNETYQQDVTLAQVLWMTPGGKMNRAYIVAKKKLSIEGDFNDLGSPSEVKQKLKERDLEPLDTFTLYSQHFHDALCLSSDRNPMDIFNQAVCIKDISNLTNFIREYMLNDGGAPQQLEKLRDNFEELRRTYERIQLEKQRLNTLNKIRSLHNTVKVLEDKIDRWQTCIDAAPLFFAEEEINLRQAEGEKIKTELLKAKTEEAAQELEANKQKEKAAELDAAIQSTEAGRRLQQINKELGLLQKQINEKQPRHKKFTKKAEKWRKGIVCTSAADFIEIKSDAAKDVERLGERSAKLTEQIRKQVDACKKIEEEQGLISSEIRSLQEREGNIDDRHMRMRNDIARALKVRHKDLPFVGELVQVQQDQAQWTGAIEKLVRSFALCVLVPERLRQKMDDYVHHTNLRGLLVYHVVKSSSRSANPQLDVNAVASKLEIHEDVGAFRDWLAAELSYRYDHLCCEEPDSTFNQSKTAITLNGLIKQGGTERRKDDRSDISDRSKDVLGWDNKGKIKALQKKHQVLETARSELVESNRVLGIEQSGINAALDAAKSLPNIADTWEEIDHLTPVKEQDDLRAEQEKLKSSSDELAQLQNQLKTAKKAETQARERARSATESVGEHKNQENENNQAIENCQNIINFAAKDPDTLRGYRERMPTIQELLNIPATSVPSLNEARRQVTGELERNCRNANNQMNSASSDAKVAMRSFLQTVKNEESKLHDELYSGDLEVPGYNDSLFAPFEALRHRIEETDLPKNEGRFKRLLQSNLVEDLSTFDGLLAQHEETIKRRIEELNRHLKQVDFDRNRHTYIKLVPEPTNDDSQKWFRALRQYALQDIVDEEHAEEQQTERFNRVHHFLQELATDEKRTRRVIDVRNWFTFRADEFFRENDGYDQSYSGASGKSGGEKNRLASTILATAIAYQYGISLNDERQTETFRLVVVDEMFSKTDDEFSTYLLELFKQFNLQLIIVQPLDSKVHLVQKYVERYHIVTRPKTISEIHNLEVHEYKELMEEISET